MQMFVNGLRLKTKQMIEIFFGGSSNFTTSISIRNIIEAVTANEYLELYVRCTNKLEGVINLKLATKSIKIED